MKNKVLNLVQILTHNCTYTHVQTLTHTCMSQHVFTKTMHTRLTSPSKHCKYRNWQCGKWNEDTAGDLPRGYSPQNMTGVTGICVQTLLRPIYLPLTPVHIQHHIQMAVYAQAQHHWPRFHPWENSKIENLIQLVRMFNTLAYWPSFKGRRVLGPAV